MKLADWMFEHGWTPATLRRELGVRSRSTIGRYIAGRHVPELSLLAAIERLSGGLVQRKDYHDPAPARCAVLVTMPDGSRRHVYPWSRSDVEWEAVIAATKAEPRPEDGPSKPVQLAAGILGQRVKPLADGMYLLDGRVVDARRLVAAANRLRRLWGQALIPYPTLDGSEPFDER